MSDQTKIEVLNEENFKDLKSYDVYCIFKQAYSEVVSSSHFCDYKQWKTMLSDIESGKLDIAASPTLGAYVAPGLGRFTGAQFTGLKGMAGAFAGKAAADFAAGKSADEVMDGMRQAAVEALRQRVNNFRNAPQNTSYEDTGDGGTSKANYSGGSAFNPTGLSQTLKPIDSQFGTDVQFPGDTRLWQNGQENTGPLIIKQGMAGLISPETGVTQDSQIWNFLKGPVTKVWNTEVAKRVTWTGRVKDLLTVENIVNYINRCLFVTQVYYYYRSIIAFSADPRNRNEGIDSLVDRITPSDYNNLWIMRREMMQSAIPPFIHEFSFYMMGTYRQSHCPGSPIQKIMPLSFAGTENDYWTGEYSLDSGKSAVDKARDFLNMNQEISNVLSRAIGEWTGVEPFEYTSSPRIDEDFNTFFVNASYMGMYSPGSTISFQFPVISDAEDEVDFVSHTDAPDGWTAALCKPLVSSSAQDGVGLFGAVTVTNDGEHIEALTSTWRTTRTSSCCIFTDTGIGGYWWPIEYAHRYQTLAGNVFSTIHSSSTYHKFQKYGSEKIILLTVNALRQANFQFLDLMYTRDIKSLSTPTFAGLTQGKQDKPMRTRGRRKSMDKDKE